MFKPKKVASGSVHENTQLKHVPMIFCLTQASMDHPKGAAPNDWSSVPVLNTTSSFASLAQRKVPSETEVPETEVPEREFLQTEPTPRCTCHLPRASRSVRRGGGGSAAAEPLIPAAGDPRPPATPLIQPVMDLAEAERKRSLVTWHVSDVSASDPSQNVHRMRVLLLSC